MKRFRQLAYALVLVGTGIIWAGPSAVEAVVKATPPRGTTTSRYAPGRFLVKYKRSVTACAHCLFKTKSATAFQSATTDTSNSLDVLHQQLGVRGITPLFRSEAQEPALLAQQGDGMALSLATLSSAQSARWARLQSRYPRRAARVPTNVFAPDLSHIYVVEVASDADIGAVSQRYAKDPHVDYAEPDYMAEALFSPTDPRYAELWGLQKIQMGPAWDRTFGQGVLVGVVDTGIDYNHADLKANAWVNPCEDLNANAVVDPSDRNGIDNACPGESPNGVVDDFYGRDLISNDGDPMDGHSHGTHVSGTIAAVANTIGVIGVAPQAKILAAKGLSDSGGGSFAQLAGAITYATDNGADVLNNSWGCGGGCPPNDTMRLAVLDAYANGVVIVFAAGNDNRDVQNYFPQNMAEVIPVAASTSTDGKASFSNFGTLINVAAPGVSILSTVPGGGYSNFSGTSMASPHVAGLAALLVSLHSDWTNEEIRKALKESADDIGTPGPDPQFGAGRINANRATQYSLEHDVIAPAAVTDLIAQTAGLSSVTLTWRATGDDGQSGTATTYDIRYASAPVLTDLDFSLAQQVSSEPAPQPAGSAERMTVMGLTSGSTYYFAMKVLDNLTNLSPLSNLANAVTKTGSTALSENFESGAVGWTRTGLWHPTQRRANSPTSSEAYNNASLNYDTGVRNSGSLVSPAIDLGSAGVALLTFSQWSQTEYWTGSPFDVRRLQISADGGATWTTLKQWDSRDPSESTWQPFLHDLSAHVGKTVHLRFFFDTIDAFANNFEGWYIDDVHVQTASALSISSVQLDGTALLINGPSMTYTVGLENAGTAAVSDVYVQATIEQGATRRSEGGALVGCAGQPVGTVPPGTCSGSFALSANDQTFTGTGTFGPGPAIAIVELRQGTGPVLASQSVPITLYHSLTLQSPNGGEAWLLGSAQTLRWNGGHPQWPISLQLWNASKSLLIKTIASGSSNDGQEAWTVPTDIPYGRYFVRVACLSQALCPTGTLGASDFSDTSFVINPLQVLVPNGSELWVLDSTAPVTWRGGDPSWRLSLELLDSTKSLVRTIVQDTPNDGTEPWFRAFPDYQEGTYSLRLRCPSCAAGTLGALDDSDQTFTLSRPTNLLSNGSIEGSKYDGWSGWGTYVKWITTEPAFLGSAFARLIVGSLDRRLRHDVFPVTPSAKYRAFTAYRVVTDGRFPVSYARVEVEWLTSGGSFISGVGLFATSQTNGWETRTNPTPLVAPATAAKVRINLMTRETWSGTTTSKADFDDVRFWRVYDR